MPINMIAESTMTLSPWIVVLRIALWLAGATLLWVGGRFIAKIPKAIFWRSLLTYFLAGIASFILSWVLLAGWWYLSRDLNINGIWPALAAVLVNLLVVWPIVKAMFRTSFKKAALAWLPTLAVLAITIPLRMTFFLPSLWQPCRIIVSHETTRLLSPVNADGTIDYLAAVDAQYSKGVTGENNAAILLLKATGPEAEFPKEIESRILKHLGISSLPTKGDYFISYEDYVSAQSPQEVPDSILDPKHEERGELLDKAMKAPWSAKDYPMLARWLKSNAKPLSLVVAASKLSRYYIPMISLDDPPQMMTTYMPSVRPNRQQGKALVTRAMLKLHSGDIDSAWADIQAVRQLARLISQGTTIMHHFSGTSLELLACRGVNAIATSGKLSARQIQAFLADIQAMPLLPDTIGGIENERLAILESVILLSRRDNSKTPKISNDYIDEYIIPDIVKLIGEFPLSQVDWNATLRTLNFWIDRNIAIDHKKIFAERQEASAGVYRDFEIAQKRYEEFPFTKRTLFMLAVPGALHSEIGRAIGITSLCPKIYPSSGYYTKTMESRMSHVAMALAAYRSERGCFPEALSELCPKYFDTLPENLFTDKPLDYRRSDKGYVLYSSGPNENDEDRLSVRIVFPATK